MINKDRDNTNFSNIIQSVLYIIFILQLPIFGHQFFKLITKFI